MDRRDRAGPTRSADVTLRVSGRPLRVQLEVPLAPTRRRTLLPIFQRLADAVVDIAVQDAEAAGERISCARGCGACCRQLVPITEPEAHALGELVRRLPQPRRAEVEARFAAARAELAGNGLLEPLLRLGSASAEERHALGLRYFALGIPCPFLEEESCSIHPDRPIACREYLVTSPAANCARPSAHGVRMVSIAGRVSTALARTSADDEAAWVPLALAPGWAEHAREEAPRPGPEIIERFFRQLVR